MTKYDNRRYLVIPVSKVGDIDFNQVLETSPQTLRYSVDGSKTFVKYNVRIVEETYTETYEDPETGETYTNTIEAGIYSRPGIWSTEYPEYEHNEFLGVLSTNEWTDNDENEMI